MRLRRPCEHIDEMHPFGHYVGHEWKVGCDWPTAELILKSCPGGGFLPEDVLVINRSTAVQIIADQEFTVQERQGRHLNGFWHYLTEEEVLALLAALDASQVGEPG